MPCYSPLTAYQLLTETTENGKKKLVFDPKELASKSYNEIKLACGKCIGCRIDKSRQWAVRCVQEASLYSDNCFITLTFDDKHLNDEGTLVKSDFQKFMKRLRKAYNGFSAVQRDDGKITYPIRFFHCGEYGSHSLRPHHHACIFNFDFIDKILWSIRDGVKLYRSASLEKLWPYGYCTIGNVTFESAAYVARYTTKKMYGEPAVEHYRDIDYETGEILRTRIPEYVTMSRRPGIGANWIKKYKDEVYSKDFLTIAGRKFRPPKYYDAFLEKLQLEMLEQTKKRRQAYVRTREETPMYRLQTMKKVKELQIRKLKRGYENDY